MLLAVTNSILLLSALPERPGEVVFIGALGEFCFASQALKILFLITSWFYPLENTNFINFS